MRDIHFSIGIFVFIAVVILLYLVRTLRLGRARHARTDADGGSVLLNKAAMEFGYWFLGPLVDLCVALRITPNMVTAFSLVPALAGGAAIAKGWLGLGAILVMIAPLCDIVDGLIARRTGVASEAGEAIDAAVDRYVEAFFLSGIVIYYRTHWEMLIIIMGAFSGSFMVSYTTAKAEAMNVPAPRGLMRHGERAVYLLIGCALTPFTKYFFADYPSHALRELPIIVALTFVAVVSNVSSVQRFAAIVRYLRANRPASPPAAAGSEPPPVVSESDTPTGLV